jgi:guanylate kinase
MTSISKGALFIVSAPSGTGKTSLLKALSEVMDNICVSISYTTRPKRSHEQEGIDYYFVTKDVFQDMLAAGAFLEHAEVFGNFYGTSRAWVEAARAKGVDVILEIDWQGAEQVSRQYPKVESIFIVPLGREILLERLTKRHQDNIAVIEARMREAKDHLIHYHQYDYLIINDKFEEALQDLKAVLMSSRLRLLRQQEAQAELLKKLLS